MFTAAQELLEYPSTRDWRPKLHCTETMEYNPAYVSLDYHLTNAMLWEKHVAANDNTMYINTLYSDYILLYSAVKGYSTIYIKF